MSEDNLKNSIFVDNIDVIFDKLLDTMYTIVEKETGKMSNDKVIKIIESIIKTEKNDSDKNTKIILDFLEQYLYYYLMIYVSNRIEDFTQFTLSFKMKTDFNAIVLQSKQLFDQVLFLKTNEQNIQDGKIIINSSYNSAIEIFNDLNEIIKGDTGLNVIKHVIIKYILYTIQFVPNHKKNLHNTIEMLEFENAEVNIIEIVEATTNVINYFAVEKLLAEDNDDNFVEEMYKLLTNEDEDESIENISQEDKINLLFNRNILVPITDDFLRYNKSTEVYEKSTEVNQGIRIHNKSNTKIKYILSKMDKVMDYNKTKDKNVFDGPLKYKNTILINDIEEMDIIKKLNIVNNKTDEQNNQLDDLLALRKYPYQSFKEFDGNGFTMYTKKTNIALRKVNIDYLEEIKGENTCVDLRIINNTIKGDIVGVAISNKLNFTTLVDQLTHIHGNNNPITSILQKIKQQILLGHGNKVGYWIFNKNRDFDKRFPQVDIMSQEEHYKNIFEFLFAEISNIVYEKIINTLSTSKITNVYTLYDVADMEVRKFIPLSTENKQDLCKFIYNKASKNDINRDEKEDYIAGLTSELIPLSKPVITKKYFNVLSKYDVGDEKEEGELYNNSQCQHIITWNAIRDIRKKHPNKFNDKLHEFIKEFVIENNEKEQICKSCSQVVDLKRYVSDWTSTTEEGIALTLSLQTSLDNMIEYEKYNVAIKSISKIIEKVASAISLSHLVGASINNEFKRQNIIKVIIDLINLQNEKIKILNSEKSRRMRLEESVKKYNISPQYTKYFLFELTNVLFGFSSQDIDKSKKQKLNNIVSYVIIMLLLEINTESIKGLSGDKLLNYYVFEKIGYSLFNDIKIKINTNGDVEAITNYKLLCYVLFILSGMVIKYNMWFSEQMDKKAMMNAHEQKTIIHTCIDILNDLLESSEKSSKYVYEYFRKKFFISIRLNYSSNSQTEIIQYLKENMEKKISIGVNGKIMFRSIQEKETVIQPYVEVSDFGYSKWPLHDSYVINSFRDTMDKYELFSVEEYDKLLENRKVIKPIAKIKKNKPSYIYHFQNMEFGDYFTTIEQYITNWESIIGTDTKINGEKLYLRHNVYTINHTYRGDKLEQAIIFTGKDKLLSFKKQDPHYLINVYTYHNKENNVHMYYNANTYEYLGYRSGNSYVNVFGTNCNLQPRFSVLHMLMFLGHTNIQYLLTDDIKEILKDDLAIEHYKLHKFISDIIKQRILNMKNALFLTQCILKQLLTDKKWKTEVVSNKFIKKLKNVVTRDEHGNIFNDINEVVNNLFFRKIPNDVKITIDKEYLYAGNIIKLNNADQDLVLYFCKEFDRFINMNTNNHNKITIVHLMSSIIDDEYHRYTYRETSMTYSDVKKFVNMESNLYSRFEKDDGDVFDAQDYEELTDEEKTKLKEQEYDEQEERDAIDIDIDTDDENANEQLADSYRDD